MNKPIYTEITSNNTTDYSTQIEHDTIIYVDDSTGIIASKDYKILNKYINDYYRLIEQFYNINFLKINPDKTKLLVQCKPNLRVLANEIKL